MDGGKPFYKSITFWIFVTIIVFMIIGFSLAYFCPESQRTNCNYASISFIGLAALIIMGLVWSKC